MFKYGITMNKQRLKESAIFIAICWLSVFSTPSFAVKTFSCDKATATVARIICNENQLSKLDDQLDKAYDGYSEILNSLKDDDRKKAIRVV